MIPDTHKTAGNIHTLLYAVSSRRVNKKTVSNSWYSVPNSHRPSIALRCIINHTSGKFYFSTDALVFEEKQDAIMYNLCIGCTFYVHGNM